MKISKLIFSLRAYLRFLRGSQTIYTVHSPQAYRFCERILNDRRQFYAFVRIRELRRRLLQNNKRIERTDLGAGPRSNSLKSISLKRLAYHASLPASEGKLLFRLVNYYQAQNILELGTCLGISTAYLASARSQSQVYTMEGDPALLALAKENFKHLGLSNVKMIAGNIDETLASTLKKAPAWDLIFIDANHRLEALIKYWELVRGCVHEKSIVVLDDIHWSAGMEQAWEIIQKDEKVRLSIDLFRLGILFFNPDRHIQHLKIRS